MEAQPAKVLFGSNLWFLGAGALLWAAVCAGALTGLAGDALDLAREVPPEVASERAPATEPAESVSTRPPATIQSIQETLALGAERARVTCVAGSGRFGVALVIGTSGAVRSVSVTPRNASADPTTRACVRDVFQALDFGPVRAEQKVHTQVAL